MKYGFEWLHCKIILQPKIKRVKHTCYNSLDDLIIAPISNDFVSVKANNCIINHYPLEIVKQKAQKPNIFIRETNLINGCSLFVEDNKIRSIVIPASVDVIGISAFYKCENLRLISFKG